MATLQELKRQIENANALGIANLTEKGVNVSADATTYDIMQKIVDIVGGGNDSGGGIQYTSIVYNDDDTITMIDTDGVTHTMVCVYEEEKLKSVAYDGKDIEIGYDSNDRLNKIGETVVGYEPFELSYADKLYAHFGIDKTTYPYIFITTQLNVTAYALYLNFGSEYSLGGSDITVTGMKVQLSSGNFTVDTTAEEIVDYIIEKNPTLTNGKTYHSYAENQKTFSNVDVSDKCTNFEMLITEAEAVRSTDYTNGFALGMASGGVVTVGDTGEIDAIEDLIDESGVLEDTEGTVTEKVEELIDKAEELDVFMCIPNANGLFKSVKSFPNKTVVNLPNATNVYQCFSYWGRGSIPMVEEIIVNAPNIDVNNNQACMGQMFLYNYSVKKVVLNMPDGCKYMQSTFSINPNIEEIVLNFSTKNIVHYSSTFSSCEKLKKITGVLDFSSATNINNMFNACTNLEEVTFAPNTLSISISLAQSSLLTSASIQSIVDGLATVTTAQTLTLNKAIVLTDEQKSTINAKGWTLAQ